MSSLRLLPISGIMQDGLTVRSAREGLKVTMIVLQQIGEDPSGLHYNVRQSLQDIAYHVQVGLSLIDTYLGAGYYQDDPITSVPGLQEAIRLHAACVQKAKSVWDFAQRSAAAEGDLPVRALVSLRPEVSIEAPTAVGFGEGLAEPKVSSYIGLAIIGLGVLSLYHLVK